MSQNISVIIPSFNSAATISFTVDSILRQPHIASVKEVILVDSSDDGVTQEVLTRLSGGIVRVIRSGTRVMPAVQRNLGAETASGDLLVFLDADAYLDPSYLGAILDACGSGVQAGSGGIALPDFQSKDPVPIAQYFLQFNQFMDSGPTRRVRFSPACNLFCRRDLFLKIGGFPKIRAAEDTLFGIQLSKHTDFYFLPHARVFHIFRKRIRQFLGNQMLIGKYTLIYRRLLEPGNILYRAPLSLLLAPAAMIVKGCLMTGRVLRSRGSHRLLYLAAAPWTVLGLLFWCLGYAKGMWEKSGAHE